MVPHLIPWAAGGGTQDQDSPSPHEILQGLNLPKAHGSARSPWGGTREDHHQGGLPEVHVCEAGIEGPVGRAEPGKPEIVHEAGQHGRRVHLQVHY